MYVTFYLVETKNQNLSIYHKLHKLLHSKKQHLHEST